jgi:hypothetical protein
MLGVFDSSLSIANIFSLFFVVFYSFCLFFLTLRFSNILIGCVKSNIRGKVKKIYVS